MREGGATRAALRKGGPTERPCVSPPLPPPTRSPHPHCAHGTRHSAPPRTQV
jgi:hypothetical protein